MDVLYSNVVLKFQIGGIILYVILSLKKMVTRNHCPYLSRPVDIELSIEVQFRLLQLL
jgi:hypothetical protein